MDREAQSEHELYIQACDQGRECSTVLVVVTVLDQNDNKPTFKSNSFNLTVPANQAGFLTRVFANDADEDAIIRVGDWGKAHGQRFASRVRD
ncbi:MAG: hypothetical protein HC767_06030 [Akkermansiaceae bacterium]|nr:hypothetical protein [Akkermansiaceae bacterium]